MRLRWLGQAELKAAELAVQLRTLEIEKLKFQIAKLRRMQFGRSSEKITRQIAQLELQLEELETGEAEDTAKAEAEDRPAPIRGWRKAKRKPLPEHLPREEIVHEPAEGGACICPACGGGMAKLGEDVTEVLDYVPGRFQVIRHVRPVRLHGLRRDHSGPGSGDANPAWPGDAGHARPSSGLEVLRSPAALSAERDICPRRCRT